MGIEEKILNIHLLTDIFGRFPSFHDAEVLKITLNRELRGSFSPSLEAVIHVFERTSEIGENNKYLLKNHSAVTFRFEQIYQLAVEDFNHQNVLQGLRITDFSKSQPESLKFEVFFEGIFGV